MQVLTPFVVVSHCVWPGPHTPVHELTPAPVTQVRLEPQAVVVANWPLELHVSTLFVPVLHRFWPGPHTPPQELTPALVRHVWLAPQATAAPNKPLAPQVCKPLPMHRVWLGAHSPTHAPLMHVVLPQSTAVPQLPVESQVCTPLLEQRLDPGAHTPEQAPFTHALPWLAHVLVATKLPVASQVSMVTASGSQTVRP